jgi:hypothetical protein
MYTPTYQLSGTRQPDPWCSPGPVHLPSPKKGDSDETSLKTKATAVTVAPGTSWVDVMSQSDLTTQTTPWQVSRLPGAAKSPLDPPTSGPDLPTLTRATPADPLPRFAAIHDFLNFSTQSTDLQGPNHHRVLQAYPGLTGCMVISGPGAAVKGALCIPRVSSASPETPGWMQPTDQEVRDG